MKRYCSLVLLASIIPALIFAPADGSDIVTVESGSSESGKVDLSKTDLTTSYCTAVGKECQGADLDSSFAPTIDQCIALCSRNLECNSMFYSSRTASPQQICYLRAKRCTTAQLKPADGTNYYRLKKGESCPDGQPAYVASTTSYSGSFCVMKDKSCPGNDLYPKPQNLKTDMLCLKKCVNIRTCSMVDYTGVLCALKDYSCSDDELVDTPGTDNYLRLDEGVTKCPANRGPPGEDPPPPPPTTPPPPPPTTEAPKPPPTPKPKPKDC